MIKLFNDNFFQANPTKYQFMMFGNSVQEGSIIIISSITICIRVTVAINCKVTRDES